MTLHNAPDALYSSLTPDKARRLRQGEGKIAIKVSKQLDGAVEKGVLREAVALGRLEHPNVVQLLDVIVEPGAFGVVEPAAEGGSLLGFFADKEKRKLLPFNGHFVARVFAYQLIRGVQYLLSRDVWHRDLKPGNLLLYKEFLDPDRLAKLKAIGWSEESEFVSRLVIADFGLSRVGMCSAIGDPHSVVVGTMRYMSPEVMLGGTYTPKSEIWSLGVIIAELFLASGQFFRSVELKNKRSFEFFPSLTAVLGEPITASTTLSSASSSISAASTTSTSVGERTWTGADQLSYFKNVPPKPEKLKDETVDWTNRTGRFASIPEYIHVLLRKMLQYDATRRPSIEEVLSDTAWNEVREYVEITVPTISSNLTCVENLLVAEPGLPPPSSLSTSPSHLVSTMIAGARSSVRLRSIALACHLLYWYPQIIEDAGMGAALHLAAVTHDRSSSHVLSDIARHTKVEPGNIAHYQRTLIRDTGGSIAPSTVFDVFRALSRDKAYSVLTRKVGMALSMLSFLTPMLYTYRVRDVALSVLALACQHTKQSFKADVSIASLPIEQLRAALRRVLQSSIPNFNTMVLLVVTPLKVDLTKVL